MRSASLVYVTKSPSLRFTLHFLKHFIKLKTHISNPGAQKFFEGNKTVLIGAQVSGCPRLQEGHAKTAALFSASLPRGPVCDKSISRYKYDFVMKGFAGGLSICGHRVGF